MADRLTLICHAGTSAQRRAAFPRDEEIEKKQLAKAAAMAGSLPHAHRVWSGPELRTRQTAEALGLFGMVQPDLRDCDCGSWRGCSLTDLQEHDPQGVQFWLSDVAAAPHGGESIGDVLDRIGNWLDAFREPGHTLAVAHPAIIRAAVIHVLKAPPSSFWRIDIEPLSATDLRHNKGVWTLRSVGAALANC